MVSIVNSKKIPALHRAAQVLWLHKALSLDVCGILEFGRFGRARVGYHVADVGHARHDEYEALEA